MTHRGTPLNDQISSNKRRTALIVSVFVLTFAVIGAVLDLLVGASGLFLAAVLGVGAGLAITAYLRAETAPPRIAGGRPAPEREYARLHNLVDGLCVAAGLPKPALYVVDDPSPNAFAAGRGPRRAALVVTSGLMEQLSRIELEGVVAHELSHIKNHDVLPASLAVTLSGGGVLPRWAANAGGALTAPLVRLAIAPRREAIADVSGVSLTRYPPGLISALEKLRADTTAPSASPSAIAHLWIKPPVAADGGQPRWAVRTAELQPPVAQRVEALREL